MTAASATGFGMATLLRMDPFASTGRRLSGGRGAEAGSTTRDTTGATASPGAVAPEASERSGSPRGDWTGTAGTPEIRVQAFASRRESVKHARDFAQEVLADWDAADLGEDLALVVSELVTNALCHGVTDLLDMFDDPFDDPVDGAPGRDVPAPAGEPGADGASGNVCGAHDGSEGAAGEAPEDGGIQLALLRKGDRVMVAVQDPGDELPSPRESDESAENGRGLCIVECFSKAWGWFPLSGPGVRTGKVVWAMFEKAATEKTAAGTALTEGR